MNSTMTWIIAASIFSALGLTLFFREQKAALPQSPAFILIELGDHPWIREAQKKIQKPIEDIIAQEMQHADLADTEQPFTVFAPKDSIVLSVYYIGPVEASLEPSLAKVITDLQQHGKARGPITGVSIDQEYHWFGEEPTHFVVQINDEDDALRGLHKELRDGFIAASKTYEKKVGKPLYPQEFGDRFPFVPHVDLGRFLQYDAKAGRWTNLKLDTLTQKELGVLDRIKERILDEIPPLLMQIPESRAIAPEHFSLYGHKHKHDPVGEFMLD